MTQYTRLASLAKAVSAALLGSGILVSASVQAAVSQAPLSLVEGVAPNMILTLDDSSSMAWSYVPDKNPWDGGNWDTSSRRFRAANTNPMYYNPGVAYAIPPNFDSNGKKIELDTAFTNAPMNGFNSDGTKVHLDTDYRVVYEFQVPSGTPLYANHPSDIAPPSLCTVNVARNNDTGTCSINGNNVSARRTRNGCDNLSPSSIKITLNGKILNAPLSCQRSGNAVTITASAGSAGIPAYYYEYDANQAGCTGKKDDKDGGGEACYRLRWVDETSAYDENGARLKHADGTYIDGKKNFAIWYSFYKNRALATLSAAGQAFYSLDSNMRFTWQSLNSCQLPTQSGSSTNNICGANRLRAYSEGHKGNFYDWLYNKTDFGYNKVKDSKGNVIKSGTPLRGSLKRAGEFLQEAQVWKKDPVANTGTSYSCRPAYHILMTDGMWNVDEGQNGHSKIPAPSNPVHTATELPDGKQYSKQAPYGNEYANAIEPAYKNRTLADYAFHYWATDLSGLPNNVPAYFIPGASSSSDKDYWDPRNNPATWQHMSNFIMGLGLSSSLTQSPEWAGSTHAGDGYKGLLNASNPTKWPPPKADSPNNIYDLWHAALNSRGHFYSVDTPEDMVGAFKDIMSRIASRKATAAAPATSNSLEADVTISDDPQDRLVSYSFQSSFDNTDGQWVGDLAMVKSWRQWDPDEESFTSFSESVWKASEKLPSHSARNIKFSVDGQLEDFNTGKVSGTALQAFLNQNPETGGSHTGAGDNLWAARVNYVRGDSSNEGDEPTQFRKRTSNRLGDFLASQPAVVKRAQYLERFSNTLEGNTKYTDFVGQANSREGRIYIGGNDGMLHGFDTSSGVEKFAFIPTAVFPKLNQLTSKLYTHYYYVDGSPEVADVYDHDAGEWKTILVGTLRAGGKGLFALDVTTPGHEKLLWEFDEFNYQSNEGHKSGMVGPGYSFPKPTIARLHNGRWAVVTGNGYEGDNTDNGKAALYIIDAMTGKLHKSLEVQSSTQTANGLSSPRLADFDGDGVADYAYAGDLHGNLWRFDLFGTGASTDRNLTDGPIYGDKNSTATDGFKVSYASKPMFTAKASKDNAVQPITAAPSLSRHPSGKGYLVILGTGKYFEDGDKTGTETHAQSLYAIWDDKTKAETTGAAGMPIARSSLVRQRIEQTNLDAKGLASGLDRKARTLSDNAVSYYDAAGNISKKGWYLDLEANSTYEGEMMIENMRVLGRDTLLISTLVPNDDPCAHGAGNWLYALNPATGGRTLHHAFDTRIKNPDGSYTLVSAIKLGNEGGLSLGQDELGITAFGENINLGNNGRLRGNRAGSWRFIPNP